MKPWEELGITEEQFREVQRRARLELCRRDFWEFCKLMVPTFYTEERTFLRELCREWQNFYESETEKVLVINEPPRHGKSLTAQLFSCWVFGKNPQEKIITGSYNEQLSKTFSRNVRDRIMERKAEKNKVVYSDIFPKTRIKKGNSAANLWALQGQYASYLATSPGGTVTGFGCSCFPAGTMIATLDGYVDIADINGRMLNRVLSFNHDSGKIEIGNISAIRKRVSDELIEIKTSSGRTIKSTVDHRFYTEERGYVRADEIKIGETFKTLSGNVRRLRKAENGARGTLLGMSSKTEEYRRRADMYPLRKEVQGSSIRDQQAEETWHKRELLLKRMFVPGQSGRTENKQMPDMRRVYGWMDEEILFPGMQSYRDEEKPKTTGQAMSCMREDVSSKQQSQPVLFEGLCIESTFFQNEGQREFSLYRRNELSEGFQGYEAFNSGKRRVSLPEMRKRVRDDASQRFFGQNESCSSSYRHGQTEQFSGQSDYALSKLSCDSTQNEEVIEIRRLNESSFVYDIQVDDNHNFFANDILVHNCMIIDDIVKNAEEAMNETVLEGHYEWFVNTMLSRLEKGGKIIIIATRWATKDLSGRIIEHYKSINVPIRVIIRKALQDDGTMLCPEILDRRSYDLISKTMGQEIVSANYNQVPIDITGRLYNVGFDTYRKLPVDKDGHSVLEEICAYIDTADQGDDYLCMIIYGLYRGQAYVLDVYFTKDGMEITEPETAKRLKEFGVNRAFCESNNGGRGFGRSIERILREKYHWYKTYIDLFTQSRNKKSRILSSATWCQKNIKFPVGWDVNYNEFYLDLMSYQREGKMKHDDAEDVLAGIYDRVGRGNLFSFN